MTDRELYIACKIGHRNAQKLFYDRFAPLMLAVCKRYIADPADAEDVFIEGMYKAMTRLDSFREDGSLEGWIRRIMVNEALMFLRRQKDWHWASEEAALQLEDQEPDAPSQLAAQEILDLVDQLPAGYRTVFNLYVLEGLKHQEISELLGISVSTSKTQLLMARHRLQDLARQQLHLAPNQRP